MTMAYHGAMSISLTDVEVRHFSALRAVAEEGTFGRAANRLGYTQSAVSQQIATLEKLVGAPLFDRPGGPRPATITPLGRRLLDHAESILDQIAAAERDLDLFTNGRVGTIAIGTYQSASVRLLPEILRQLRDERPGLEVQLDERQEEDELVDGLLSRRLDVSFLARKHDDPRLRVVPLLQDPFVVVMRSDAKTRRARLEPLDLVGQPLVSETLSSCTTTIESGLRTHGVEPNVVFRTQDNTAVQAMVRSGIGQAVMPALAVDANDPQIRIAHLDPPITPRYVSVAVLANRNLPPSIDRFLELAGDVAGQLIENDELLGACPE